MSGFNCYWEMPFREHTRITIENLIPDLIDGFFYQINYTLTEVNALFPRPVSPPKPAALQIRLHDPRRRSRSGPFCGRLHGMGRQQQPLVGRRRNQVLPGWRRGFSTICGTGTEDYFGGAWGFEQPAGRYGVFTSPFSGMPQVILSDGLNRANTRFGLYRFRHVMDPVRFKQDLRVTMQALGWRMALEGKGRYLALQDDIASTAYWYQVEPHAPFPTLPTFEFLEVI